MEAVIRVLRDGRFQTMRLPATVESPGVMRFHLPEDVGLEDLIYAELEYGPEDDWAVRAAMAEVQ